MSNSAAAVRPIEDRSVASQVTAELRRSILSGTLPAGQRFSLRELAEKLGVSIIPVREALRDLEQDGLVSTRHGRSAVVAPLERDDLKAIYRLRRILEPELARLACVRIREKELAGLEALVANLDGNALGPEVVDARSEFYLGLFAPAATAWDMRIITTLWRAASRYIPAGVTNMGEELAERVRHAHEDLIAAFRTGDPDTAAAAVRAHLDLTEEIGELALTA